MSGMCGGLSGVRDADFGVQKICQQVKLEVEEKSKKQFSEFTAHTYATQVVAGTNYFVKVHVGKEEYIHIRVFQPLREEKCTVSSFVLDKTKDDALAYF